MINTTLNEYLQNLFQLNLKGVASMQQFTVCPCVLHSKIESGILYEFKMIGLTVKTDNFFFLFLQM